MGEKLLIGPINHGFETYREPFVIDNDSFPLLVNAYAWRGRVKRKRGTVPITQSPILPSRLLRFFDSTIISYNTGPTTITLDGAGAGNLISGFGLETNANIIPTTVAITGVVANYVDDGNGNIITDPGAVLKGTINYATGEIVILDEAGNNISASFVYAPSLPVMGQEDLVLTPGDYPGSLQFDTRYSYNLLTVAPYSTYDVSFYKNLPTGTYVGYVQKTNWSPTRWNGQDYQQFWSTNYGEAFWVTNGITIPFTTTNIGLQFKPIVNPAGVVINVAGPPALVTLHIVTHNLVVGDFVFLNEIGGITGINGQTGYVTAVIDADHVQVTLPNAVVGGAYTSGGIAQYLTSQADPTLDCIRWYDGDPTNGSSTAPTFVAGKGWVNFMPPLSNLNFSFDDAPVDLYYLAGARVMLPFKDRLLFFGPVIQTSAGRKIYLQDAVVYSQNGTPFYTASFEGPASLPTSVPQAILTPTNQTADPRAFMADIIGFGGETSAGVNAAICTASPNEDGIIVGFDRHLQTRLMSTGDDIFPFNFYLINSELGSASTFSTINMDNGVITRGTRGYIITNQNETQRIDLQVPDQFFQIRLKNNGSERVTAVRNYINEWIYTTYPSNQQTWRFPNQTLMYNYRDNTYAVFNEAYTTYGLFRRRTGFTWATVGFTFPTWAEWNQPWNTGGSTSFNPVVIAGNQQGFIFERDQGTGEYSSLYIQSISGFTITSPDHCLNEGDYIIITGIIGTIGTILNGQIFSVYNVTQNTFILNSNTIITPPVGTYFGGGVITRMYVPQIQSKQFPIAWAVGRKTRLGPQQYLFTKTNFGQVSLLIFLSQNGDSPYNNVEFPKPVQIVPDPDCNNNALIYTTLLFTCQESTNLGLTPANINLQTPTASQQNQIWHRMNTSLIGDTVQFGISLNDAQMRSFLESSVGFPITAITQANPCVITVDNDLQEGNQVVINGVVGMVELNNNVYTVIVQTPTTITIGVDSSAFSAYISGGTVTQVGDLIQFSEIEFHSAILDVSPSQLLV